LRDLFSAGNVDIGDGDDLGATRLRHDPAMQ